MTKYMRTFMGFPAILLNKGPANRMLLIGGRRVEERCMIIIQRPPKYVTAEREARDG